MTWPQNRRILLAMFVVNMVIGIGFALIGGWPILPFAGLEIAAVGMGMNYVCWKLNFKHIITLEAESLVVQKGVYFPKNEWQWQKSQTRLIRVAPKYRLSPPDLYLNHLSERLELAEFLDRDEKKEVIAWFERQGILTCRESR